MSFAALKKRRGSDIQDLAKRVKEQESSGFEKDSRFWELTKDKQTGLGEAIIRFLPESDGSDTPFVLRYNHGFKEEKTGRWFIENCPTTLGENCPVCESNSEYWNTGIDANKKISSARKRQKSYYSNIYVVSDPANPENNGKVFLYRYGVHIFKMISDTLTPEFDGDERVNVFDLWEGANFRLRATKNQNKQTTYEKSSFANPTPLKDSDEELEQIWKQQHKLEDLIAPSEFKSSAELLSQFNRVIGKDTPVTAEVPPAPTAKSVVQLPSDYDDDVPEMPWGDTETTQRTTNAGVADDPDFAAYKALMGN